MFFLSSVSFPACDKCPQGCRSSCGGQTSRSLAGLGSEGFECKGGFDLEGGVHPAVQDQGAMVAEW